MAVVPHSQEDADLDHHEVRRHRDGRRRRLPALQEGRPQVRLHDALLRLPAWPGLVRR